MVLDFPKSRIGPKVVNLYREDITPQEAFKNSSFQSLSKTAKRDEGSGRPTKKERREIDEYHKNQNKN